MLSPLDVPHQPLRLKFLLSLIISCFAEFYLENSPITAWSSMLKCAPFSIQHERWTVSTWFSKMMQSHLTFAIGCQRRELKLAEYYENFGPRMDTWVTMAPGNWQRSMRKQGLSSSSIVGTLERWKPSSRKSTVNSAPESYGCWYNAGFQKRYALPNTGSSMSSYRMLTMLHTPLANNLLSFSTFTQIG